VALIGAGIAYLTGLPNTVLAPLELAAILIWVWVGR
jgi:hypothetical protein